MSKLKHFIRKVASAAGSKRNSLKSTVSEEATAGAVVHQNVVDFAKTTGEVDPSPQGGDGHHNHGRRRNRSLSLTEEKVLRSEVREVVEEREKERQLAEKKKAYDEACSSSHICGSLIELFAFRIL